MQRKITKLAVHTAAALLGAMVLTFAPAVLDKAAVFGIGAETVYADEKVLTETTGTLDAAEWKFDYATGELTITGNGNGSIDSSAFANYTNIKSVAMTGVTQIFNNAFDGCSSLTSVSFGDGVTTIESSAFSECVKLNDIVLPGSLETIGDSAFYFTPNLRSITIPENVDTIGSCAFQSSGLTSVTIASDCLKENGIFEDCKDLETVTLSPDVTVIPEGTFNGCVSLSTITLPAELQSIGAEAFAYCSALTSINIPDRVVIEQQAFFSAGLTSLIIPGDVELSDSEIFERCPLVSVTMEEGIKSIPEDCFGHCHSLESVVIPNTVTIINDCAFEDCTSLSSIKIPASLIGINENAFDTCSSLTDVYSYSPASAWDGLNNHPQTTFHVPANKVNEYKTVLTVPTQVRAIVAIGIADSLTAFDSGYYCVDEVNGNTYIIVTCTAEQANEYKAINIKSDNAVVNEKPIDTVYQLIRFNDDSELDSESFGGAYITAIKFTNTAGKAPTGTLTVEYVSNNEV